MATKKTTENIDPQRYPLMFDTDSVGGCCGTIMFCNIEHGKEEYGYGWRSTPRYPLESRQKVFHKFLDDIDDEVKETVIDGRNYNGAKLGAIILITKFHKDGKDDVHVEDGESLDEGQVPGLGEFLLENGWQADRNWINSNTGNELTMFTKMFKSPGKPGTRHNGRNYYRF